MNILCSKKADKTALVLIHIDGTNGYCLDKDGDMLVIALTGLKFNPVRTQVDNFGNVINSLSFSDLSNHLFVKNLIEQEGS